MDQIKARQPRFMPGEVSMAEANPFMQRWVAKTVHPLDRMCCGDAFLNYREVLAPGAEITIAQFTTLDPRAGRLIAVARVFVVQNDRSGIEVSEAFDRHDIPAARPVEGEKSKPLEVIYATANWRMKPHGFRGNGEYEVINDKQQTQVAGVDKETASRIIAGHIGLLHGPEGLRLIHPDDTITDLTGKPLGSIPGLVA